MSSDSTPAEERGRSAGAVGPVWVRPPERKRERLTLDDVITAAIALADAEGVEAVSVRRVAAQLKTRPMGLYSFFTRKDDLLDLMVDRIMGETLLESLPEDWREALKAIARHTRNTSLRHPWLMALVSQRPSIGPNAMRHIEQSLLAIAGLGVPRETARDLLMAVDVYTVGAATTSVADRQIQMRDGLADSTWRATIDEYFAAVTRTAEFPHLAAIGNPELLRRGDAGQSFDAGLDWLLDGFAAAHGLDGHEATRVGDGARQPMCDPGRTTVTP